MRSNLCEFTLVTALLLWFSTSAAQDSTLQLKAVVISGYDELLGTSLSIEKIDQLTLEQSGSQNVSSALAQLPGVQVFSTGNAISKPVVRGLYGNRILVLYNGLKLDNQQWQDEHGLGLSNFGLGSLELIKGPMAVLYGSGSNGGVINIVDAAPAKLNSSESDALVQAFSNTAGLISEAGYKINRNGSWRNLRLGVESHADYLDGNGKQVLNSRFNGYYLKAGFGFKKHQWLSQNHYHFSYNQFGFVFSDMSAYLKPDDIDNRKLSGPHHRVMLNFFSSENKRVFEHSVLHLNAGVQSNFRAEDEGGGFLALMMHLTNTQVRIKWKRPLSKNTFLVLNQQSTFEVNSNFGARKIVPDAQMFETNASAYLKHIRKKLLIECGLGFGTKGIKTLLTPLVNAPNNAIHPFSKWWTYPNIMLGLHWQLSPILSFRSNVSTGVRAPNLAELSANGLHEGIYIYELGDPNLRTEQNLNAEIGWTLAKKGLSIDFTVYRNQFSGFIYLQPGSEDWFGFPKYRFEQRNAVFRGGEIFGKYQLESFKLVSFSIKASMLKATFLNQDFLPNMPANTLTPGLDFSKSLRSNNELKIHMEGQMVFAQNKVSFGEEATPAYQLINASFILNHQGEGLRFKTIIGCNNLLNQAYYSHLSRLKTFNVLNMGRNIFITFQVKSIKSLKL